MERSSTTTAPKDAAVVILIRQDTDPNNPEVFWVKRSDKLAFLGGFHAFPGGQIDADDAAVTVQNAPNPETAAMISGAARELFEELGVLVARGGETLTKGQRASLLDDLESHRMSWSALLDHYHLHLDADDFTYVGRWVTPPFNARRFDTWFFLAKCPAKQEPNVIAGELAEGEWLPAREVKTTARFSQFAVAAAKMARSDSGLDTAGVPSDRVKVAIGTSLNGHIDVAQPNYEAFLRGSQISPWAALEFPAHAATAHVAIHAGATGQTTTFATACAAGLDAIGWAAEQIASGSATVVVAGAAEAPLSEFMLRVFHSVGVLSKWQGPPEEASRPFDMWRSGLVLAEGAAVVTVESQELARTRRAPVYAKILGASSANEGTHLRKVDETGDAVAQAIEGALRNADLAPRDVDLICAHGNSMQDYDAAETAGIKRVFGSHAWNMPVSSPNP